jgi:hypothetical protein
VDDGGDVVFAEDVVGRQLRQIHVEEVLEGARVFEVPVQFARAVEQLDR